MTKNEYLSQLGAALRKSRVADADEILTEYEQHFTFKLADGYAEEEIAAKLEKPEQIAAHYTDAGDAPAGKLGIKLAMGALSIFEGLAYTLFFVWIIAIAVAALAFAALGVCLLCNANAAGLIPAMPYLCAATFGVCTLALAVIFALAVRVCLAFFFQIIKSGIRRHKIVTGETALPPLPWTPQLGPVKNRRIRNTLMWALVIFGITFILGYLAAALYAGSFGFWHTWGWFVGG